MGLPRVQETNQVDGFVSDIRAYIKQLEDRIAQLEASESVSDLAHIQTTELSASATTIDFSSIPSSYRHLQIIGRLRSNRAAANDLVLMRLNNISSANYDYIRTHLVNPNTAGTAEGFAATSAAVCFAPGATSPANVFSTLSLTIPDYLETTQHPIWHSSSFLLQLLSTGNLFTIWTGGRLRVAGAINRITLLPELGTDFVAGSYVSLYGFR